ncbi:hypothetical protein [Marivita sp.]|uniref:hypothetical protein n=1 Tax=Marivita sp. TaxID=2003365 RepID=UPI0025C452DF|nr:hypothetical protein [Marivita sp.]
MKTLIAATALSLSAISASAMVNTSEINKYAPNVDISTLSQAELNTIVSLLHSADSASEKRAVIYSLAQ